MEPARRGVVSLANYANDAAWMVWTVLPTAAAPRTSSWRLEIVRSLSPFAGNIGAGGSAIFPERQTAVEVAVNQFLARTVRLDVSYWRRWVENAANPNVFFGTTIIFPNSVAKGRASGVDVRLELPRRRGWFGYLSYANSPGRAIRPRDWRALPRGGTDSHRAGHHFTPDHDQRNVGAFSMRLREWAYRLVAVLTGRYESGPRWKSKKSNSTNWSNGRVQNWSTSSEDASDRDRCSMSPWSRGCVVEGTLIWIFASCCSTSRVSVGPTTSGIRSAELTSALAERSKSACEPASAGLTIDGTDERRVIR